VETNTGPLGHGFPVAVGIALSGKLDGVERRTFVLTGDGELQEGSMWEAAMAAGHYELDKLVCIVDRKRLQQGDRTETTMGLDPLPDKFRAFGWTVREVEGNDPAALLDTFGALPFEAGKPSCIVANTTKGKGVSFMEDQAGWHHRIPTDEEFERAVAELEASRA
jgi:transketolase